MTYNPQQIELEIFLLSMNKKVERVFKRFPTSVQSDQYLLEYFKWMFGSVAGKEDAIKRAGRHLRFLCKKNECGHEREEGCFVRGEKECLKAHEQEKVHRDYYGDIHTRQEKTNQEV